MLNGETCSAVRG